MGQLFMILYVLIIGIVFYQLLVYFFDYSKICPYCKEKISKSATKCSKCTKDL